MAIAGYKGKVKYALSADSSPIPNPESFVDLTDLTDVGYNPTRETLDAAYVGGGGQKAYISGLRDLSLSLSGDYGAVAPSAGKILSDAFNAEGSNANLFLKIFPDGGSTPINPADYRFIVSNLNIKTSASGKVTFEATLNPAA